ncbi:MAG: type I-E CRISPR-associated protein Cas6/Cse3/CasE [Candidatus Thiodiazotropha sp. (ex Dulcina madagascariensis)]|nr:type I-E CRISPR-associated protein Cas6/Cse3/CasE [Candidatus Thiodiazotropha sp. (ex Dulcina madagascariensis)]
MKETILRLYPSARYEGVIDVIDNQAFGRAFRTGIGPAKGLGCGLLSLAPA